MSLTRSEYQLQTLLTDEQSLQLIGKVSGKSAHPSHKLWDMTCIKTALADDYRSF